MANEFDLGFNIASIETELPDPVITLTGSDNLTAAETAEMPLLALTAYGRSWQGERVVNIADVGIEGYGLPVSADGNYTDANGQQWICDEIVVNADGTGKIVKRTLYISSADTTPKVENRSENIYSLTFKTEKLLQNKRGFCSVSNRYWYSSDPSVHYYFVDNDALVYLPVTYDYIANPVSMVAILAEPTETEITSEQLTALQPLIDKYGAFTAYFMSTQDGTPTPENPVPIVSTADLHRVSVPIESIGDGGSLTITTCGNNLFDNDLLIVSDGEKRKIEKCDDGTLHFVNTDGIHFMPKVKITLPKGEYSITAFVTLITGNGYIGISLDEGDVVWLKYGTTLDFNLPETTDVYIRATSANTSDPAEYYFNVSLAKKGTNTAYEPYKSTTATITTALPLRGLPVSSGGNHTDSNGQEWVCDTIEHIYGEPAQVTRRIAVSSVSDVALDTLGMKSVIQFDANYINHPGTSYRWYRYYCDYIVAYESPSAAYGVFYECHGIRYAENCDLGPYVKESSSITGQWGRPEEFTFYGDIRVPDSLKSRVSIKPVVTLANGTTDPETYICETEKLTVGAEVIYPQKAETVLLTTKETNELNSLDGFAGSTTIYNDSTAEMTVKLLREDFEMQYIHWIKESQSFVCEKAGKYKIICVGGGSSGGIGAAGAAETMQAAGTTTSFGTIISAEGGGKSRALMSSMQLGSGALIGGQSGYDGINYGSTSHVMAYESAVHFSSTGSNSSVMWGTGHGYGAGGGARGYSDELVAAGGRCGKVESTIVDLEENQTIACTIGGGGVLVLSDANVLEYLKTYVDPEKTSATGEGEKVSACVSSGADGVIVIQYLGL